VGHGPLFLVLAGGGLFSNYLPKLEQLAIFLAELASWMELNFCQFFTWRLAKCSNENALIYFDLLIYITVACKFVIPI
jgi:hypothetical protein